MTPTTTPKPEESLRAPLNQVSEDGSSDEGNQDSMVLQQMSMVREVAHAVSNMQEALHGAEDTLIQLWECAPTPMPTATQRIDDCLQRCSDAVNEDGSTEVSEDGSGDEGSQDSMMHQQMVMVRAVAHAASNKQKALQEAKLAVLQASQRARELKLPIDFDNALDDVTFDDYFVSTTATMQEVVGRMHSVASRQNVDGFYVGVTGDPSRRWRGGVSERGDMRGHGRTYQQMVILAFRAPGLAAPLEKFLIETAMQAYGGRCLNVAKDSRGCVKGVAGFLYIVLLEPLDDPLLCGH